MRRLGIYAAFAALLLPALGRGADLGGANVGATWTRLGAEARSASLAGAMSAVEGGLSSLGYNSAGLASLTRSSATLGYLAWVEGTSLQTLAVGLPWGPGVLAGSLDYFNAGKIDRVQAPVGGGSPRVQGTVDNFFLRLGANWAQTLGVLQVGGGLYVVDQSLDGASAMSIAMDLGLRAVTPLKGLSAGLAFQGLGPDLQGAPQPGTVRLGAAYRLPISLPLVLSLDYETLRHDLGTGTLDLGVEAVVHPHLSLRGGFKGGSSNAATGLTAGVGFNFDALTLNYAFQGLGDLGASHLLSLDWAFQSPWQATARPPAAEIPAQVPSLP